MKKYIILFLLSIGMVGFFTKCEDNFNDPEIDLVEDEMSKIAPWDISLPMDQIHTSFSQKVVKNIYDVLIYDNIIFLKNNFDLSLDKLRVFSLSSTGEVDVMKVGIDLLDNNFIYQPGDQIVSVNLTLNKSGEVITHLISAEYVTVVDASNIELKYIVDWDVIGNPFGYENRYWTISNIQPNDLAIRSIVHQIPTTVDTFSSVGLNLLYLEALTNVTTDDCTNNRARIVVGINP